MADTGIDFMAETTKPTSKPTMAAKQTPPKLPERWSCRDLRLPKEQAIDRFKSYQPLSEDGVKAGKTQDPNIRGIIPDEDRAWIIRKIQNSGFAGVVVDVHDHKPDGSSDVGGWHISKLY